MRAMRLLSEVEYSRYVEIELECMREMRPLISGYMMGSPTRERAQCLTLLASCAQTSAYETGVHTMHVFQDMNRHT